MIGLEDLWLSASFQSHHQSLQTGRHVKPNGEFSRQNVPGIEIHNRHRVEEPLLQ